MRSRKSKPSGPPHPGTPMSPADLNTELHIGCRAEIDVKNIDKTHRCGTVHWLGAFGHNYIAGLKMDYPSGDYLVKIEEKYRRLCFDALTNDNEFVPIFSASMPREFRFVAKLQKLTMISHRKHLQAIPKSPDELDAGIQINSYVEVRVEGIEKARRGTVHWLGTYGGEPVAGLIMELASFVYIREIDMKFKHLCSENYTPIFDWDIRCDLRFVARLNDVKLVTPGKDQKGDEKHARNQQATAACATSSGGGSSSDEIFQDNAPTATACATGSDPRLARDDGPLDHKSEEISDAPPSNPGPADSGIDGHNAMKMKSEITNVKQEVNKITSTLPQMKQDIFKEVEKVQAMLKMDFDERIENIRNGVVAVSHSQAELNEEKYKKLLEEEKRQRTDLETRHFRLIAFIFTLFIARFITETVLNFTQSSEEYNIDDTISQSAVVLDRDYEMSVKKMSSMIDSTMSKIQSDFPDEDGRFWSSIYAPIRRIIQEEHPSRPAVILIATARPHSAAAECLSREVASQVETLYDPNDNGDSYITIEAAHLNSLDPDKAKSQMDHDLSGNYQGQHMVAVIHDLGSLPATAATLLHAYCDHESAHFKKVVLLATVYLDPGITLCTEEIEAYLSEVWQELEEDVLKPLISRVANNIAIMENRGIGNYVCKT